MPHIKRKSLRPYTPRHSSQRRSCRILYGTAWSDFVQ